MKNMNPTNSGLISCRMALSNMVFVLMALTQVLIRYIMADVNSGSDNLLFSSSLNGHCSISLTSGVYE